MARPQKDGMDYFPHDVYASSDEKIEPLLFLYGAAGYAFYFIHLEYIYRTKDFEFDISDAETIQILCSKLRICEEDYQKILNTALKHGCFDKNHFEKTGRLTSDGIKKRAKPVIDKRDKMRQQYENKQEIISAAETPPETHIEKESKVKERKEIKEKEYCPELSETDTTEQPLMEFPLSRNGDKFPVFKKDVAQWQDTFPGVDVQQALRECRQWNIDNPQKRKTRAGIKSHISRWLGKIQNSGRGGCGTVNTGSRKHSGFENKNYGESGLL